MVRRVNANHKSLCARARAACVLIPVRVRASAKGENFPTVGEFFDGLPSPWGEVMARSPRAGDTFVQLSPAVGRSRRSKQLSQLLGQLFSPAFAQGDNCPRPGQLSTA